MIAHTHAAAHPCECPTHAHPMELEAGSSPKRSKSSPNNTQCEQNDENAPFFALPFHIIVDHLVGDGYDFLADPNGIRAVMNLTNACRLLREYLRETLDWPLLAKRLTFIKPAIDGGYEDVSIFVALASQCYFVTHASLYIPFASANVIFAVRLVKECKEGRISLAGAECDGTPDCEVFSNAFRKTLGPEMIHHPLFLQQSEGLLFMHTDVAFHTNMDNIGKFASIAPLSLANRVLGHIGKKYPDLNTACTRLMKVVSFLSTKGLAEQIKALASEKMSWKM